ncbi:3-carboxy-cis,cis-muconate cycloisomerase [Gordonia sp. ABSL49_1]|uniref:3-carboxy-cis,cis-muconate cycloisomerase n=1 Tax=Gordonia sp. ABSL49_1 TaxID=2920941 RepID=UPI001F0D40E1|nr:3-carboxy-cis,cis-muconate cycloisomerase [Gordonia sp. ABSL49_1]MCH5644734.1 3-carboxy-cis,cis-muconate cycloisomerase [Gordonia sp. ABSL49_1]
MTDLFWPGDHRAGSLMSDAAFVDALVAVEDAWLGCLVDGGVAPDDAATDMTGFVTAEDPERLAAGAEREGNPVTGLVALLRERTQGAAAQWIHRGLTSQDVVDTAVMLCLQDAVARVARDVDEQIRVLVGLVEKYRDAPMLAHTLTQPALPSTAGKKFAVWLSGVLDAASTLDSVPAFAVQMGGAAGTLAATTELTGSPDAAVAMSDALADRLGLARALPWHTTRAPITRVADALVGCTDTWGHIANDVLVGSRGEISELTEAAGGGSSTMPHKSNPMLSVLIRRSALAAPALGATLHTASASSVDERSDGGWHVEWSTVRTLARRTVVAAGQTTDLLVGLRVGTDRSRSNLEAAQGILAEQSTMAELADRTPASTYLGAVDHQIDTILERARHHLKESS